MHVVGPCFKPEDQDMALHRRAAKRDDSEPEVVEAFLDGGATVIKHSGPDEADLVVGYQGRTHCVEVKTGNAMRSEGQEKWAENWQGGPVLVIRNAAQARKALTMWSREAARQSRLEAIEEERR